VYIILFILPLFVSNYLSTLPFEFFLNMFLSFNFQLKLKLLLT